jgi:hypothetical protein
MRVDHDVIERPAFACAMQHDPVDHHAGQCCQVDLPQGVEVSGDVATFLLGHAQTWHHSGRPQMLWVSNPGILPELLESRRTGANMRRCAVLPESCSSPSF